MAAHWRSDHKSLATSIGELNCRDIGSGHPVVFVHGIFMNGGLWDDVVFYLPPDLRAIRPDFPFGGHSRAANATADLTPTAVALLLLELIETLDLANVTLVANDIGNVICQRAIASRDVRTCRITRLLLTNCGSLKNEVDQTADTFLTGLSALLRTPEGRREFFRPLTEVPIPDEQLCDLLGGFLQSEDVRRDAQRVLQEMLTDESADAALPFEFPGPVSVVWGLNDPASPIAAGEKLASRFPNAHLSAVTNARRLIPIDQPEMLANAIIHLLTCDIQKTKRTLS